MKPKRDRPFVDLEALDVRDGQPRDPTLFLKRFDEPTLQRELTEAGLFAELERRGYAPLTLHTGRAGGAHRLQVFGHGEPEALIDLRIAEESRLVSSLAPRPARLDVLSALSIHWLEMQDPHAAFMPDRPQLPGQRHPGLRLTRALILRIHAWGASWGKDAVLNVPEYFHNAVFYSGGYRFLSAEVQGRFEALRRDLAALSVPQASAAVEEGRVVDADSGKPVAWEPAEMVAPLTEPVRRYLDGAAWRTVAAAACAQAHFRVTPG